MNRILLWDLPVRLFHWLLAGGLVFAAVISLVLGEDSPLFPYHAIVGLAMALMVCLRVAWGVVGSRYARFWTFVFSPGEALAYMKATLVGGGKRYIGHNPGSALAILGLLALVLAMAGTGILMGQGNEGLKEVHEVLAYVFVGVAAVHVAGVGLHTIQHRENITASMIHGKKSGEPSEGIESAQPIVAAIFLLIVGAFAVTLVRGYDPAGMTITLPVVGTVLQVGENENGAEGGIGNPGDADDD
ncbi:MAG: cytochrome b/b6 domain-containing protein [Candidatus Sumerlaeia bacterium]|nr:cytochrome b/b6 domain-containing protein [Candidatus Sumerlaeia bacterium]